MPGRALTERFILLQETKANFSVPHWALTAPKPLGAAFAAFISSFTITDKLFPAAEQDPTENVQDVVSAWLIWQPDVW